MIRPRPASDLLRYPFDTIPRRSRVVSAMGVLDRFRLDGRTAFVTGGSRGLGRAMAQALAEAGADLILVGREVDTLAEARSELERTGRTVHVLSGDVGTPEGAAA